ncbi:asparaginase [Actinomyces sp. Z5]|uniref:asparaginase domain-containing protein n=1 Tax=Actinomyces sp. Z5 TaxID=2250216 RepID=UPI000DCEBBB5|nr:asparaginase domain-containing protein [Actinomyces sp. Z5]RAX20837.1 asparaginase [Actinomyces sp. Z5]
MHVHFTYAGGTIGMVDSPHGLQPGADLEAWLADLLAAFPAPKHMPVPPRSAGRIAPDRTDAQGRNTSLTTLHPLLDSAQAAPQTWQSIVNDLYAHADVADAFVVLHGTDTMAYTASALSYALTELKQPVIVTGSQLPLGVSDSDAVANVVGALQALTQGAPRGVHLFFGGRLLAGNRATKISTWSLTGFDSPSAAPLALAGAPWHWTASTAAGAAATVPGVVWKEPAPFGRHDVIVVDAVPGLSAARLAQLLTPPPVAVVLRAFGVGNLPPELTAVIAQAVAEGVAVVVSSQCLQGEVELGRYAAGDGPAAAGAVGSGDMTLEATYAKLQFLASQGLRGAELGAWMGRNLAGELTVE